MIFNTYKKTTITLLLFCSPFLLSQGFAINTGYDFIGRNAGFLGLEYRLTSHSKNSANIGLGSYLTSENRQFTLVPEIHYNQTIYSDFLMGEISANTKSINPSLGFNLLNLLQLKLGYNIPFDKNSAYKGISFGLHFFIGNNKFYNSLNLIK